MNVLIVDDNTAKAGKLAAVLEGAGLQREAIEIVASAMKARERLRAIRFDLLVVDLLLPQREEDEPALRTALSLLDDVCERDAFLKPRHIVGFTAFVEQATAAAEPFRKRLWGIVPFDETSDSWEVQFANVAAYLLNADAQNPPAGYETDLCVVTALDVEMRAVHQLQWNWDQPTPLDDHTFVRRGRVPVSEGSQVAVVAACAPRMGSVAAALLASKLITRFRPRFLAMTGICAGVRGKVEMGDVVLFDPVWEWSSGKLSENDDGTYLEPSPHQISTSEFLVARAAQLASRHLIWSEVKAKWHSAAPSSSLSLVVGPGASGSAVVSSGDTLDAIRQQHRKLAAIEMEAYGICAAARLCSSPRPTAFVLKSVCDYADETKSDEWQAYAAYTSAAALNLLVTTYYPEIRNLAGN